VVTVGVTVLRNARSPNKTPIGRLTHSIFDEQRNHVATSNAFIQHFTLITAMLFTVYTSLLQNEEYLLQHLSFV